MVSAFIVLQTNTLARGEKKRVLRESAFLLYYSDDSFGAGDDPVESARSNFHPTKLHI